MLSRAPLDTLASPPEPLRIVAPELVEAPRQESGAIPGGPVVGFGGFLDGIQRSEVLAYHDAVPVVRATVAAVVRVRRDRRMTTWAHRVDRACYAPRMLLSRSVWNDCEAEGAAIDTSPRGRDGETLHPWELVELAVTAIQRRRDGLERDLVEQWCATEQAPLYVDGPLSARPAASGSLLAAGVVKNHRTLYVSRESLSSVLALRVGERTSAFRIATGGAPGAPDRMAVASWYLRVRDPLGHEPFWGLVRVEIPDTTLSSDRADLVSRWVLAEASPVALPDARWATLAYGVRDCEEFLRAII